MSDLISRQAAIEIVRHRCKRCTTDAVLAITEIEQIPYAQPHWIPCSERLPDYGEVVLWCNKHGSVFASAITYQSVDYFSVGKHGGSRTIIAWMPLPKPYGGESE